LVVKPGGKRQLGRPNSKCENNIKMDLKEIDLDGIHWIHMA
jgi:hypothetical protein